MFEKLMCQCGGNWFELLDDLNETKDCGCGEFVCMNCDNQYSKEGRLTARFNN